MLDPVIPDPADRSIAYILLKEYKENEKRI